MFPKDLTNPYIYQELLYVTLKVLCSVVYSLHIWSKCLGLRHGRQLGGMSRKQDNNNNEIWLEEIPEVLEETMGKKLINKCLFVQLQLGLQPNPKPWGSYLERKKGACGCGWKWISANERNTGIIVIAMTYIALRVREPSLGKEFLCTRHKQFLLLWSFLLHFIYINKIFLF